jgi:glutathione S-transferase
MLKLYGTSMSRAARSLWALEEVGQKYEHVPINVSGDTRKTEFLEINPNGHVPTLEDDGAVIWESMAINLYLAEKYGKAPLWPAGADAHGQAYQWSFFAMTELETHLLAILTNKLFAPPDKRDPKAADRATEAVQAPLKILENHLKDRDYLLGKDFTIADLNVASVLSLANFVRFDFSSLPSVKKWLDACLERPAQKKASSLK